LVFAATPSHYESQQGWLRLPALRSPFSLAVAGETWVYVSYLKQKRGQLILACFLMTSLLLSQFPGIDLQISRVFFHNGFALKREWWGAWLHESVTYFLWLSMLSVAAIYGLNRALRRNLCGVDGKKVCYLFLVLILGAGLIVNVVLKDTFGRARPRDVEEFGGAKHFTPAFVLSRECATNCSFSSGDGAGAFFSLALAMALRRKRAMFVAGVGLGSLVSFSRVASGAHFFSDTVVSFFVMLIVADVLHHYMFLPERELEEAPVPGNLGGNAALVEPD
jgi:lipid A 4'-phosphatase